eukprot:1161782-Pelagomonas_calceolata.AAC.4
MDKLCMQGEQPRSSGLDLTKMASSNLTPRWTHVACWGGSSEFSGGSSRDDEQQSNPKMDKLCMQGKQPQTSRVDLAKMTSSNLTPRWTHVACRVSSLGFQGWN